MQDVLVGGNRPNTQLFLDFLRWGEGLIFVVLLHDLREVRPNFISIGGVVNDSNI